MDSSGRIHDLGNGLYLHSLEQRHGKLVPIPAPELEAVRAMPVAERQAWYNAKLSAEQKRERKAARKRQRAARKQGRR
jgi:hypothetical protein